MPYIILTSPSRRSFKFLIDSGSNINLVNPGICVGRWRRRLEKTHFIFTIYGSVSTDYGGVIPVPEFGEGNVLDVLEYSFSDKFDGLIGWPFLRQLKAIINCATATLFIGDLAIDLQLNLPIENPQDFTAHLHHISSQINDDQFCLEYPSFDLQKNLPNENPHEFTEYLHHISTQISDDKFRLDHLNPEEHKCIKSILQKYDDIFYHEGETLSFTNQIKHRIRTKHEDPIYSKLYRYPQKYKEEVDKQIATDAIRSLQCSSHFPKADESRVSRTHWKDLLCLFR